MNEKFDIGILDSFDDPDKFYKAASKVNDALLVEFEKCLTSELKFRKKEAAKHVDNIRFFGNEYLAGYEGSCLWQGYNDVVSFLGHWFIKKAMWADESVIKENVISFQAFYDFLAIMGRVKHKERKELQELIDEGYPTWLERMARYDDPEFEGDWFTGDDW